jgi:hypothetical protein
MRDLDPSQYGEADRRAVDPPVQVEMATWSPGSLLDWWVTESGSKWWGRVRGADNRRRWIRAADLRPGEQAGRLGQKSPSWGRKIGDFAGTSGQWFLFV